MPANHLIALFYVCAKKVSNKYITIIGLSRGWLS
jgi:hypothetical protein